MMIAVVSGENNGWLPMTCSFCFCIQVGEGGERGGAERLTAIMTVGGELVMKF